MGSGERPVTAAAVAALALACLVACTPSNSDSVRGAVAAAPAIASHTSAAGDIAASTVVASLDLPAPGSYRLDRIMEAPHGAVLASDGSAHRLAEYTEGKVTLFSFIYTACSDARGCPLALATMHALKAAIESDPRLRAEVRLVSMSFDPDHDTAAVMRSYGGADGAAAARPRWFFLTTQSARQLAPLLAGFGQDVHAAQQATAPAAGERPQLAHLLKIYLIDRRGVVREIYSPAFLRADVMLGDIRTLAAERE